MKIVIDIPKDMYESIKQLKIQYTRGNAKANQLDFYYGLLICLKEGVPLPKGHGRLIDADSLIKAIEEKTKRLSNTDTINGLCGAVALIYDEQAIIESDTESEDN